MTFLSEYILFLKILNFEITIYFFRNDRFSVLSSLLSLKTVWGWVSTWSKYLFLQSWQLTLQCQCHGLAWPLTCWTLPGHLQSVWVAVSAISDLLSVTSSHLLHLQWAGNISSPRSQLPGQCFNKMINPSLNEEMINWPRDLAWCIQDFVIGWCRTGLVTTWETVL